MPISRLTIAVASIVSAAVAAIAGGNPWGP